MIQGLGIFKQLAQNFSVQYMYILRSDIYRASDFSICMYNNAINRYMPVPYKQTKNDTCRYRTDSTDIIVC